MTGSIKRESLAGMFDGTTKLEDLNDTTPDRSTGIPAPPADRPTPPPTPKPNTPADNPTPAPAPAVTRTPARHPTNGMIRFSIQLDDDTHSRLRNATNQTGEWLHNFIETALDRHEPELRQKDAIRKYRRRRRDAPTLKAQSIRVTAHANKRIRALANLHKVSVADATRAIIKTALDDLNDSNQTLR